MTTKSVHKGQIFGVAIEIDSTLRNAMDRAPAVAAECMAQVASEWHENIVKKHFEKSAHAKYGYAQRSGKYLRQGRKRNKPDMVLSGQMRNQIVHRASIVTTRTGAVLKMSARALNFCGAGEQTGERVTVGGRTYPNMKREVKAMTSDEVRLLTERTIQLLEEKFNAGADSAAEQFAAMSPQ